MIVARTARRRAVAALLAAIVAGLVPAGCGRAPEPVPAVPAESVDPASRAELERIVHAETTLAYSGWRTVSHGPRGESRETRLRVSRRAGGPTLLEWPGDVREPASGRRWTAGDRLAWVGRPELLLRNYRLAPSDDPAEPVAWRATRALRIEPRDPTRRGRPVLVLLVDAETGLVLAESARDAAGGELRSARFESIEYGDPGPVADAEPIEGGTPDERPPEGFRPRPVPALPAGFERVEAARSPCGAWREDFSDGLAGFSVLQRPAGAATPPAGEVRRRTRPGGASLTARAGDLEVTVAGSLPAEELLGVLRGLGAGATSAP